ncbi:right-handed parallel beta-helix repeat-containing protein, partial [Tychonema sp. BBK16]|uniref:right-handed parallel beta-helix repeat-containing protein n=1 Tax=Tychonema sp. BBK16 TaxID=2699888 RepID=UPI0038D2FF5E
QVSELEHQLETVSQSRSQLQADLDNAKSAPKSEQIQALTSEPELSIKKDFIVSQQGKGDYTTISEALKKATSNSHIYVYPGLYQESLILDKSVEIIGKTATGSIVIESANATCIQMQTDSALVRGLTLSATGKNYAVDIREGELVIEDCDITSADYSVVGICGNNASSVIRCCQIHDGIWNGIFISDYARATVEDSDIFDNGTFGIGVGLGGKLVIRQCRISGNGAEAIAVYRDGIAKVKDCDLTGNSGGTLRLVDNGYVENKSDPQ